MPVPLLPYTPLPLPVLLPRTPVLLVLVPCTPNPLVLLPSTPWPLGLMPCTPGLPVPCMPGLPVPLTVAVKFGPPIAEASFLSAVLLAGLSLAHEPDDDTSITCVPSSV